MHIDTEINTYEIVNELLIEYNSTNNEQKKEKLKALIVTNMLPIIRRIAHTIARRSYDPIEDMIQAGAVGLLKAIKTYSSEINDNFKIYAGYLIIGEMKHYLRDKLSTIRVPGHIQQLLYRINTFSASLTVEELNDLTNDDIAEVLHVSPKAVDTARQLERRSSIISLDEIYSSNSESLNYEEMLSNEDFKISSENHDYKIILQDILVKLPPKTKEYIDMYYNQDLTQKEIAIQMGLSIMQVHRRLKKIFKLMHSMINGETVNLEKFDKEIEA